MGEAIVTACVCFSAAGLGIVGVRVPLRQIVMTMTCLLVGHDFHQKHFAAEGEPYHDVDPWLICARCKEWRRERDDDSTGSGLRVRPFAMDGPGHGWPVGN